MQSSSKVTLSPTGSGPSSLVLRVGVVALVAAMLVGAALIMAPMQAASAATAPDLLSSPRPDGSSAVTLEGRTVSGLVYVLIRSDGQVRKVDFLVDGKPLGTSLSLGSLRRAPIRRALDTYSARMPSRAVAWDTRAVPEGRHQVTAHVTFLNGVSSTAHSIVFVRNRPVELLVSKSQDRSSPSRLDGSAASGRVYVFTGPDNGVRRVVFTLNGAPVADESHAPFDMHGSSPVAPYPARGWDTRGAKDGQHRITANVELTDGQSFAVTAVVTVSNPAETTPSPSAPPSPSPSPSASPPAPSGQSDFPSAATTGVPAGTVLTRTGGMTITTPGAVVSGKDIQGPLVIRASNVTVRASRVTTSASWAIDVQGGARNVVIEDVEVNGQAGCEAGIAFDGFLARRVDVHGCKDGLKMRHDARVEKSYVHDLYQSSTSHNDGIQIGDGGNIAIVGNNIQHPNDQTSAILIKADFSAIDNVTIAGNLLNGGNYTVYVMDMPGNSVTNVRIENNHFGRAYVYGHRSIRVPVTWSGNVWHDNGAVA